MTSTAVVAASCALAVAGCGGSAAGTVKTDDPAADFAPLVLLDSDERFMPVGARWFIDRSVLRFAEDQGCEHLKIAVGRKLRAQHNPIHDWIYVDDVGTSPVYWRNASDATCDLVHDRGEFYANQLTRPHDPGARPKRLRPGEGFYFDLMDWARRGAAKRGADGVPVYVQSRRREVDGEPGLTLAYWLLFGMSEAAHEGDWERIEVLLRGDDGEYEPVSVRASGSSHSRDVPWDSVPRSASSRSGAATHPVVEAARGSHALRFRSGRCSGCERWRTWRRVEPVVDQLWYGFGGAWGEAGATDAKTGPLGPMPARRR